MVSRFIVVAVVAVASWGQTSSSPLAVRQESSVPPSPKPAVPLTPEMRGDILMARKMFREAVESYSAADKNSAVIANKIGIAYHQMLELDLARKSYERALKLDPRYSEAVNNLGTIYY